MPLLVLPPAVLGKGGEREELQEVTASLAAAKGISTDRAAGQPLFLEGSS